MAGGVSAGFTLNTATSTALLPVNNRRKWLFIQNNGANVVIIACGTNNGASAVSPGNGFQIAAGGSLILPPVVGALPAGVGLTGAPTTDIAGIAIGGASDVVVLEN